MQQYVDKICLNLEYDNGNDICAGESLWDEILHIVQTENERDFSRIIAEKHEGRMLFHLSPLRQNIVAGLDISKDETVLEIGSGCGAITGKLAQMAKSVTCIELSKKKSVINANRNRKYDNIKILVGDFDKISENIAKTFDVITLIGLPDYARDCIDRNQSFLDFLIKLKKLLSADGKIIIAIENKYGLRYWAGEREEHSRSFFNSIRDYVERGSVKAYAKDTLCSILTDVGLKNIRFYYPYPDYLYPCSIYTDDYLPVKGELTKNITNYNDSRMLLFNEAQVYDSLIGDELFPLFSNSYLVECSRKESQL